MRSIKILLITFFGCIFSVSAWAENPEVIEGQFILIVRDHDAHLALDVLDKATNEEVTPIHVGEFVTVVEVDSDPGSDVEDDMEEEVITELSGDDVCLRFMSEVRKGAKTAERLRKAGLKVPYKLLKNKVFECEPNGVFRANALPNDQHYPIQWSLPAIGAPQAWNSQQGSASTIVAVIDTGVSYTHPDLIGNMWVNPGEVAGNGIDDDNSGYIDDVHGMNAINGSGDPMDDNGHGTHCAGTIGAKTNNGVGVSGVTWNVQIMGVKFLGSNGSGSYAAAVRALDYVTNMRKRGINIVASNNSWGGTYYSAAVFDAVRRATQAGVLTVAAAGNSSSNNDTTPHYPSGYSDLGVIAVAATNPSGNLASFSNYGKSSVHLAAPGESIASTYLNNQYVYLSGTSMATPHVTGAIALLASHAPSLDWSQLKAVLLNGTTAMGSLSEKVTGSRFLNLPAMLQSSVSPPPPVVPTPTPAPTPQLTPTPTPTPQPGNWHIGASIFGANNLPIEGVSVSLVTEKGVKANFVTGPSGMGAFGAVAGPTNYTLTIERPGYLSKTINAYLTAHVSHAILLTGESYPITVKTVNSLGLPLHGVLVDGAALGTKSTIAGQTTFTAQYGADYKFSASLGGYYCKNLAESRVYGPATRVIMCKKVL